MAESRRSSRKKCQICGEGPTDPVSIPCGHSFCIQCIKQSWAQEAVCHCPDCGARFSSRPQLTRQTTLAESLKKHRADSEERKQQQHSDSSTQTLKRPYSCTETQTTLCRKHNKTLDSYCCTDEQIICAGCAAAEHSGHTIGLVRLERTRIQKELENIQTKSKQILKTQEKQLKSLEKTLEQIPGEASATLDYCESVLVEVIDSLQRHFLSVKQLIEDQEEAAAAKVQASVQTLQMKTDELRKTTAELDRLAKTDTDARFLETWPRVRRLCEKDHHHQLSEDPLLPFKLMKRGVEELGRQLEELSDKGFTHISHTADRVELQASGGETEDDDVQPRSEANASQSQGAVNDTVTEQAAPKTRAEFLRYACGLSFDPNTAHRDLLISDGGKTVKVCPLNCQSPAPRSLERFIRRRQLLCREGLQAERCYYEIEVEGDKAEVALAYKGMDRRSSISRSGFGANANSWSLDRSTKYSVSHRGDSVELTASPSHHRIGVYLEFKTGALSFYEVTDTMVFLYKVKAEFTEPLYPGFWLGDNCCIRICDLREERV